MWWSIIRHFNWSIESFPQFLSFLFQFAFVLWWFFVELRPFSNIQWLHLHFINIFAQIHNFLFAFLKIESVACNFQSLIYLLQSPLIGYAVAEFLCFLFLLEDGLSKILEETACAVSLLNRVFDFIRLTYFCMELIWIKISKTFLKALNVQFACFSLL